MSPFSMPLATMSLVTMPKPLRRSPLVPLVFAGLLVTLAPFEAGCGAARARPEPYPEQIAIERERPDELHEELRESDRELGEVLARPEPDCERACELGGAICELRTRICDIAERHPGDRETADRCTDATARCEGATERIAARCACDPAPEPAGG